MAEPLSRLRELRQVRTWSQGDVAFELKRVARLLGDSIPGADAKTVGRWERGIIVPTKFYIRLLCLVFDVAPDDLGLPARPLLRHELEGDRRRLAALALVKADREQDQQMEDALLRGDALPSQEVVRQAATLEWVRQGRVPGAHHPAPAGRGHEGDRQADPAPTSDVAPAPTYYLGPRGRYTRTRGWVAEPPSPSPVVGRRP